MRIHLASDHVGFEVKNQLAEQLRQSGHEAVDHGPFRYDADDDYPVFCLRAAEAVAREHDSLGVVLGGSGNGEQISANKVRGIRAALAWSTETARLARQHNDARVISVGVRLHSVDDIIGFVDAFVTTPFSRDDRHARRIAMLRRYEETGELPPLADHLER
ncbi:MAG: ribose-5-phosphate isomerase [Jiangellaceae bacterium]|jgi:ribose 5-phosphate isomerase B